MSGTAVSVLPSGLVVPPLPYLAALIVAALIVAAAVSTVQPVVTDRTVVAFVPWMVAGAALHALYQIGAAPAPLEPFFSAPTVYATTFLLAGGVWTVAAQIPDGTARWLAAVGAVVALVPITAALRVGATRGTLSVLYPLAGLVASVLLAGAAYGLLRRAYPSVAVTGAVGPVVVFGHALDGVSTALGVDVLGVGERSPLPRAIMDLAAGLPTAAFLGTGWLFVLVKLAVAAGMLALFVDFTREEPTRANLVLGVVAAVGLGPGAHNLLLFAAAVG